MIDETIQNEKNKKKADVQAEKAKAVIKEKLEETRREELEKLAGDADSSGSSADSQAKAEAAIANAVNSAEASSFISTKKPTVVKQEPKKKADDKNKALADKKEKSEKDKTTV